MKRRDRGDEMTACRSLSATVSGDDNYEKYTLQLPNQNFGPLSFWKEARSIVFKFPRMTTPHYLLFKPSLVESLMFPVHSCIRRPLAGISCGDSPRALKELYLEYSRTRERGIEQIIICNAK